MCVKHCILSTFLSPMKKKPKAYYSGGIQTHDLCHSKADVLPLDHGDYPVERDNSNTKLGREY